MQRHTNWTEPQEIKETWGTKRANVDLSYGGEGSCASRWLLELDSIEKRKRPYRLKARRPACVYSLVNIVAGVLCAAGCFSIRQQRKQGAKTDAPCFRLFKRFYYNAAYCLIQEYIYKYLIKWNNRITCRKKVLFYPVLSEPE